MTSISVVMPVFNEESTLREAIFRVLALEEISELIVVDDGSTDKSWEIISECVTLDPARVRAFRQPRNLGKGAALRFGFRRAISECVAIQDADLEYDPRDLLKLFDVFQRHDADVVYGSRFLSGDERRVLLYWHSVGNRMLTRMSNIVTNLNLSDMETCYKVIRRSLLDSILIEENRFGVEPELTIKLAARNAKFFEVGISYAGRSVAEGKKIGWKDGFSALRSISRYGRSERRRRSRHTKVSRLAKAEDLRAGLENLQQAANYNAWIGEKISPYLGCSVLEVGAGSGNLTVHMVKSGRLITAVEPDSELCRLLAERVVGMDGVVVRPGLVDNAFIQEHLARFDAVVAINVLEHIEDDALWLDSLAKVVSPGGKIVLWVPALEVLYSKFDARIGHYRRYDRKRLRALGHFVGLETLVLEYHNRIGALGWLFANKGLGLSPANSSIAKVFDRYVQPWASAIDQSIQVPLGQSILAVYQVPQTSGTCEVRSDGN